MLWYYCYLLHHSEQGMKVNTTGALLSIGKDGRKEGREKREGRKGGRKGREMNELSNLREKLAGGKSQFLSERGQKVFKIGDI